MSVFATTWRRCGSIVLLVGLAIASSQAPAKVYKWVDEKGKVHYSSTKPPGQSTKTLNVETGPRGIAAAPADSGDRGALVPSSPAQSAAYLKDCTDKMCDHFRETDPKCESPACQAGLKRLNPWDDCTAPICAKVQAVDPKCQTSLCTRALEADKQCAVNRILCVSKSQDIEKDLARRKKNDESKADRETLSKLRSDARRSGRRGDYNKYLSECRRQGRSKRECTHRYAF